MIASVLFIAALLAATPATKFINVTATTDANLSVSIELVGKRMKVALCCPPTRQYSLAISSGTCANPGPSAGAVVVERNDWHAAGGRMIADVATIFPLHGRGQFHLFVLDDLARSESELACGDVPPDLVTR